MALETGPFVLIDTDVASYFLKNDSRGDLFKPFLKDKIIAISFITLGELYFWAVKNAWGTSRISDLENKISHYVLLPYDKSVSYQFALTRDRCEKSGSPVNYPDYWIAACALRHNFPLVTNNIGHFKHIAGLKPIIPNS